MNDNRLVCICGSIVKSEEPDTQIVGGNMFTSLI
jgi:hypothetical protein